MLILEEKLLDGKGNNFLRGGAIVVLDRIDHFRKTVNSWKIQGFFNDKLIKFSVALGCKYCVTLKVFLMCTFVLIK